MTWSLDTERSRDYPMISKSRILQWIKLEFTQVWWPAGNQNFRPQHNDLSKNLFFFHEISILWGVQTNIQQQTIVRKTRQNKRQIGETGDKLTRTHVCALSNLESLPLIFTILLHTNNVLRKEDTKKHKKNSSMGQKRVACVRNKAIGPTEVFSKMCSLGRGGGVLLGGGAFASSSGCASANLILRFSWTSLQAWSVGELYSTLRKNPTRHQHCLQQLQSNSDQHVHQHTGPLFAKTAWFLSYARC